MSANTQTNQKNNVNVEQEVEVLYQKLGERWFAFSVINDEVFMTPISEEQITEIRNDHSAQNGNHKQSHHEAA